jgi:hypothetical protein
LGHVNDCRAAAATNDEPVKMRFRRQRTLDCGLETPQGPACLGKHGRELAFAAPGFLQADQGVSHLLGENRIPTEVTHPLSTASAPAEFEVRPVARRQTTHFTGHEALACQAGYVLVRQMQRGQRLLEFGCFH